MEKKKSNNNSNNKKYNKAIQYPRFKKRKKKSIEFSLPNIFNNNKKNFSLKNSIDSYIYAYILTLIHSHSLLNCQS